MDIQVNFYNHDIVVTVNERCQIRELKVFFQRQLGIHVAEQRLYEQGGHDELRNGIYLQDLVNAQNRGLNMELRNPDDYMVDLVVILPGGIFHLKCLKSIQVVLIRNACCLAIPANVRNIRLQVDDRLLDDDEHLLQFANGTVIRCTVDQNANVFFIIFIFVFIFILGLQSSVFHNNLKSKDMLEKEEPKCFVKQSSVVLDNLILEDILEKEETKYLVQQSLVDKTIIMLNDGLGNEGTKLFNTQSSFDNNSLNLKQMLGKGGFGVVFDAMYKNYSVIVKSSVTEEKNRFIIEEYNYLKLLQQGNFRGIPKIGHCFVYEGRQSFMMEKLGSDLNKLQMKTNERKFQLKTTLKIAMDALQILKSVHSCGIVHNDIKPENLLTGLTDPKTLYLIDFSLSTKFINDDEHIPHEKTGKFIGTPEYSSISSLDGMSLSRRDDLESLAYTLIKLATGKLPWEEILRDKVMVNMEIMEIIKIMIEEKKQSSKDICDGMPEEFVNFLDEVRSLKFDQKPQYDKYYKMFKNLYEQLEEQQDEVFDG